MNKPEPSYAPVYAAACYPDLAVIARQHGYALTVHGSLQRDFDLVAIPWADQVHPPEVLIAAIQQETAYREIGTPSPVLKNHGRIAYSLNIGFGNCGLDLSFMGLQSLGQHPLDGEMLFGSVPRSSQWPEVRDQHLRDHPYCEACGGTLGVQVHHVKPYHLHPLLELDPSNLMTLCTGRLSCNCHLTFGHLGNWQWENPKVREMVAEYRRLRERRQ